jgi:hypothetical protein
MNELRDRLQELADAYARSTPPTGAAAARRRGHQRRRRAVAGVVVLGMLAVGASVGLLTPKVPRPTQPVGPRPAPAPVQVPRSTAWFQATYLPRGFRLVGDRELPAERLGPPVPVAQSFRLVKGDGEFTVSVNPELRQLDVAREARTYPKVRVVRVRGHAGLLFPRRPDNFYTGLTWEERPGLVMQVLGSQGVPDRMLLEVAQGLRIGGTSGGKVAVTVGPPPPGWIRVGRGTRWPTLGDSLTVLPRSHRLAFDRGRGGGRSPLAVTETRGQYAPLRSAGEPRLVPETRREAVTVHGYPALLDHDPINRFRKVTWREPGGIELEVLAGEKLGRREVLAIAEGLRQP